MSVDDKAHQKEEEEGVYCHECKIH